MDKSPLAGVAGTVSHLSWENVALGDNEGQEMVILCKV